MAKVVMISCSSQKQKGVVKARDMYISSLFTKSLEYAQQLIPAKIFVLSAKYELLELDQIISPYNKTLKNMGSQERNIWGKKVIDQLEQIVDVKHDEFVILAGEVYISPLRQYLPANRLEEPMKGKRVGERLQWLNDKINNHDQ